MRFNGPANPGPGIHLVTPGDLSKVAVDPDVGEHVARWHAAAERPDVFYFWVAADGLPVADAVMHDMTSTWTEAFVDLHVFRTGDRGRGIGTRTLSLGADPGGAPTRRGSGVPRW